MTANYELVRHRAAAIAIQESSRGVREEGANNRGPRIDVYRLSANSDLSKNQDWCGMFVYYCLKQAATLYNVPLPFIPEKLWSGYKFTLWARENPSTIVCGPVHPGDVYVMNWGHIGIVRGFSSGNVIETVDGNQSHMGGGLSLKCRTRKREDMRVVVRI